MTVTDVFTAEIRWGAGGLVQATEAGPFELGPFESGRGNGPAGPERRVVGTGTA